MTAAKGALAYDADKVTRKYWAPLLAELAAEIDVEVANPTDFLLYTFPNPTD